MLSRLIPLVFVVLWSTGFIFSKMGAPYAEPFTFLGLRFGILAVLFTGFCLIIGAPWPDRRTALHAVVVGVLIHGVYLGGVFWAIDRGMSAGISALIVGIQPVLTAFIAVPWLGERLAARHWFGLVLGLIGITLVLVPKIGGTVDTVTWPTVTACILALLGITIGSIYQKQYATGIDLRTGASLQYVGATAAVGIPAFVLEDRVISWEPPFIFALAWLIIVLSVGAITLLMVMIRRGAISQVASYFYLVPASVALIAWPLFGETLQPIQIAGMVFAALAVVLVSSNLFARRSVAV